MTDIAFRNTLSSDVQEKQMARSLRSVQDRHGRSIVCAPVATDWQGQAVCMLFYDYVIPPNDSITNFGFLPNLPDLWSKEDNASALHEVVLAIALMSLAHRSSLDYLVHQARQRYGKFLQLIAKALGSPEELKQDSVLAAILCANVYEVSRYVYQRLITS